MMEWGACGHPLRRNIAKPNGLECRVCDLLRMRTRDVRFAERSDEGPHSRDGHTHAWEYATAAAEYSQAQAAANEWHGTTCGYEINGWSTLESRARKEQLQRLTPSAQTIASEAPPTWIRFPWYSIQSANSPTMPMRPYLRGTRPVSIAYYVKGDGLVLSDATYTYKTKISGAYNYVVAHRGSE